MLPLFALLIAPSVDLENRVARLPDLVAELASEGNANLSYSKELTNELVYIRSQPRPLDAWLPLIAEAVGAEWEDDGKVRRLVRSPALKRRLEAEEIRAQTDICLENARLSVGTPNPSPLTDEEARRVIATAFDLRKADRARTPNLGSKVIDAQKDLVPTWRLMRRLLTRETLSEFVTVPVGEVGYWSSIKRPMRRILAVNPSLLREYNRERNLIIQTLGAGKTPDQFRTAVASTSDYWNLNPRHKPAAELILTVQRYHPSVITVNVRLQDADGETVDQFGPTISFTLERATWPGLREFASHRFTSPALEELAKGLARESDAFAARALAPVRNEPGDLYLRPVLDAACEKSRTDAVIGLPDAAISLTVSAFDRSLNLTRPLQDLEAQVAWRIESGLMVGHPRYPIEATRTRLDRAVFQDLLARLAKGGEYRLDTFADYAARQNPNAGASDLERLGISASRATHESSTLTGLLLGDYVGYRDTLRLYGQLSPPQKRALWAGEPIPVAGLALPAQQTLIRRVFHRDINFEVVSEQSTLPDGDAPRWLPSGIPTDTVLQAKVESNPGVIVADGSRRGVTMNLDSLAHTAARQQAGEDTGFTDFPRTRFSPVTIQLLPLSLRFSSLLKADTSLIDLPPLGTSSPPLAELPADFLRRIETWIETFRKQRSTTKTQPAVPPPR